METEHGPLIQGLMHVLNTHTLCQTFRYEHSSIVLSVLRKYCKLHFPSVQYGKNMDITDFPSITVFPKASHPSGQTLGIPWGEAISENGLIPFLTTI